MKYDLWVSGTVIQKARSERQFLIPDYSIENMRVFGSRHKDRKALYYSIYLLDNGIDVLPCQRLTFHYSSDVKPVTYFYINPFVVDSFAELPEAFEFPNLVNKTNRRLVLLDNNLRPIDYNRSDLLLLNPAYNEDRLLTFLRANPGLKTVAEVYGGDKRIGAEYLNPLVYCRR